MDERMALICSLVREGSPVLDVGTDHATVPIELVKSKRSPFAAVTDISRPSLNKGIKNINAAGLSEKIKAYCADGTLGVPLDGIGDIIIAGMGGELIAEILSKDERLKSFGLRFILQPMTKAERLRKFLYENGFTVLAEKKVISEGRVYAVISAEFNGKSTEYTLSELLLGVTPNAEGEADRIYAERLLAAVNGRLDGLKKAEGENTCLIAEAEREKGVLTEFLSHSDKNEKGEP